MDKILFKVNNKIIIFDNYNKYRKDKLFVKWIEKNVENTDNFRKESAEILKVSSNEKEHWTRVIQS